MNHLNFRVFVAGLALGLTACVPSPGGDPFSALHSPNGSFYGVDWEGSETTIVMLASIRERAGNTALCISHTIEGRELAKLTRQVLASTAVKVGGVQLTRSMAFSGLVASEAALTQRPANCIVTAEPWRESFVDAKFEFVPATTTFFVSE